MQVRIISMLPKQQIQSKKQRYRHTDKQAQKQQHNDKQKLKQKQKLKLNKDKSNKHHNISSSIHIKKYQQNKQRQLESSNSQFKQYVKNSGKQKSTQKSKQKSGNSDKQNMKSTKLKLKTAHSKSKNKSKSKEKVCKVSPNIVNASIYNHNISKYNTSPILQRQRNRSVRINTNSNRVSLWNFNDNKYAKGALTQRDFQHACQTVSTKLNTQRTPLKKSYMQRVQNNDNAKIKMKKKKKNINAISMKQIKTKKIKENTKTQDNVAAKKPKTAKMKLKELQKQSQADYQSQEFQDLQQVKKQKSKKLAIPEIVTREPQRKQSYFDQQILQKLNLDNAQFFRRKKNHHPHIDKQMGSISQFQAQGQVQTQSQTQTQSIAYKVDTNYHYGTLKSQIQANSTIQYRECGTETMPMFQQQSRPLPYKKMGKRKSFQQQQQQQKSYQKNKNKQKIIYSSLPSQRSFLNPNYALQILRKQQQLKWRIMYLELKQLKNKISTPQKLQNIIQQSKNNITQFHQKCKWIQENSWYNISSSRRNHKQDINNNSFKDKNNQGGFSKKNNNKVEVNTNKIIENQFLNKLSTSSLKQEINDKNSNKSDKYMTYGSQNPYKIKQMFQKSRNSQNNSMNRSNYSINQKSRRSSVQNISILDQIPKNNNQSSKNLNLSDKKLLQSLASIQQHIQKQPQIQKNTIITLAQPQHQLQKPSLAPTTSLLPTPTTTIKNTKINTFCQQFQKQLQTYSKTNLINSNTNINNNVKGFISMELQHIPEMEYKKSMEIVQFVQNMVYIQLCDEIVESNCLLHMFLLSKKKQKNNANMNENSQKQQLRVKQVDGINISQTSQHKSKQILCSQFYSLQMLSKLYTYIQQNPHLIDIILKRINKPLGTSVKTNLRILRNYFLDSEDQIFIHDQEDEDQMELILDGEIVKDFQQKYCQYGNLDGEVDVNQDQQMLPSVQTQYFYNHCLFTCFNQMLDTMRPENPSSKPIPYCLAPQSSIHAHKNISKVFIQLITYFRQLLSIKMGLQLMTSQKAKQNQIDSQQSNHNKMDILMLKQQQEKWKKMQEGAFQQKYFLTQRVIEEIFNDQIMMFYNQFM